MSANVHFEPEPGSRDAMPGIGVPKPALYMAAVLILMVFALAISARVFGFGAFAEPQGTVLLTRTLTFTDAADGGIYVHDAETKTLATTLEPGTGNFVRGALRALTRKRRLAKIGPEIPFVLTRYDDGRLVLRDSATKASVTVSSFGPTQMEAFDPLLIVGRVPAVPVPSAAATSPGSP
jgi:putative photosynthetic complex assembly protein